MFTNRTSNLTHVWALCGLLVLMGCSKPDVQENDNQQVQQPQLTFSDVTSDAGLGEFIHNSGSKGDKWYPETVGAGGGFLDYNGDGWQDILLVEGGTWRDQINSTQPSTSIRLYRNDGDGTFTDVSENAGLDGVSTYAFGVSIADYDNDGDDDFFLTTLYENLLFRNDKGRYVEVGKEAGVSDHVLWSTASIFFDADRDGWLDLFVANYVEWSPETDIW